MGEEREAWGEEATPALCMQTRVTEPRGTLASSQLSGTQGKHQVGFYNVLGQPSKTGRL